MNLIWLFRMKRWAQRPPSAKRVKFILLIILACLALVAYEKLFGWPAILTLDNDSYRRVPRF